MSKIVIEGKEIDARPDETLLQTCEAVPSIYANDPRCGLNGAHYGRRTENMTLVLLREIRAKQDEHSQSLADQTRRFDHLERRLDDLSKVVRYSLGQSAETQFRQSQQEQRIDELFAKLEDLLKPKEPA